MEVILQLKENNIVVVKCDNVHSHEFDLNVIHPDQFLKEIKENPNKINEAMLKWGEAIQKEFIKPESLLSKKIDEAKIINLVCLDNIVQSIPWELMHEEKDFLVCKMPFLRTLPQKKRIPPPGKLENLHIIGVFSSPLDDNITPLNTKRDWIQLRQIIQPLPYAITLERCLPPTLRNMRSMLAGKKGLVIHFNGHGGQDEESGYLLFEKTDGSPDPITTKSILSRVENIPLLVELNACFSATTGPSEMNNIAHSLVGQGIPYTIGMQFPIEYQDARLFSNTLYSEIASGSSVEDAIGQARLELSRKDTEQWAVGIPIVYTSLKSSSKGFAIQKGTPNIKDNQTSINLYHIPSIEGDFQGRNEELVKLGKWLTSQDRPHLITIHAGPGTGKTALAREAAERFAFAFPGGVLAINMEETSSLDSIIAQLANHFNIALEGKEEQIKASVLNALSLRDTLLVLDNFETILHEIDDYNQDSYTLAQFIKQELRNTQASLLLTSWELTGWPNEKSIKLVGLKEHFGARLFSQWVPNRIHEVIPELAQGLSEYVGGHPLSLRLLGGSFNSIDLSMQEFIKKIKTYLTEATDRYAKEDHRHKTIFACFDASLQFLEEDLKDLLFKLQIFHAPFNPEIIIHVLDQKKYQKGEKSLIFTQLLKLEYKGWLTNFSIKIKNGQIELLHLPAVTRIFLDKYHTLDKKVLQTIQQKIAKMYEKVSKYIYEEVDKRAIPSRLFQAIAPDMENVFQFLPKNQQASFSNIIGWTFWRVGYWKKGTKYLEHSLLLHREVGDRAGEAATLNNIGGVYRAIGKPKEALEHYQQALPIMREVSDRAGEAAILDNISSILAHKREISEAINLKQESIHILNIYNLPCDAGGTTKEQMEKEVLELKKQLENKNE